MRFIFIAFLLFRTTADGTTLYTTGGSPLTYSTTPGNDWQIGAAGTGAEFTEVADSFSPTSTGKLGAVDIGVEAVGGSGSLIVAIETGSVPTTVVESLSITPPSGAPAAVTLPSILQPQLTAGSNYWLVVSTTGNVVVDWWVYLPRGADFELPSGGGWQGSGSASKGAFDLQSSAVPEVSSVRLLAVGMFLLGAVRRATRPSPAVSLAKRF